jgi:hypothetical protein
MYPCFLSAGCSPGEVLSIHPGERVLCCHVCGLVVFLSGDSFQRPCEGLVLLCLLSSVPAVVLVCVSFESVPLCALGSVPTAPTVCVLEGRAWARFMSSC